jgi:hypothetical protein
VPVALQVWMVAAPELKGVHRYTFSGDEPLLPQLPL